MMLLVMWLRCIDMVCEIGMVMVECIVGSVVVSCGVVVLVVVGVVEFVLLSVLVVGWVGKFMVMVCGLLVGGVEI